MERMSGGIWQEMTALHLKKWI